MLVEGSVLVLVGDCVVEVVVGLAVVARLVDVMAVLV